MESVHPPQPERRSLSSAGISEILGKVTLTHSNLKDIEKMEKFASRYRQLFMDEFVDALRTQIGSPVLPNEALENIIDKYIIDNADFTAQFSPNERVCIVPIHCNERGDLWNDVQLERFEYIHVLFVDPKTGRRSKGFPGSSSPLFQFLPKEVQTEMSFIVPEKPSRIDLIELITAAYRRGQFYFDDAGQQPEKH